jgi:type IX secretion system PorP/SprF family membrane protein
MKTRIVNIINCLAAIALLSSQPVTGQDFHYSQFISNQTYYNPAYVGLHNGLSYRVVNRKPWINSGNNYSYNMSFDIAERSIPGAGGIGILVNSSNEAFLESPFSFKMQNIGIMPSVRIRTGDNSVIQVGAMAGIGIRSIELQDGLIFPDQLHPRFGYIGSTNYLLNGADRVIYPDFSFGAIYQFVIDNFISNIGFASHHLTTPNIAFINIDYSLPRRYVAHVEIIVDQSQPKDRFTTPRDFKINPGFMYQHQGGINFYSVGSNFNLSKLYLGLWFRNESLLIGDYSYLTLITGLNIPFNEDMRIKFFYSYDLALSRLMFAGPSHEVGLIFELDRSNLLQFNPYRDNIFNNRSNRSSCPYECSPF